MRRVLLCLCLFSALASAQSFTGSIRGTVTDSTSAAVPNAKVTVTDADRQVEYPTTADDSGRYIFPTLPGANYTLTVEAPGFRKFTQPAFRLAVQQQATVNVELSVGEVTTTVEVQASAPLLNTTSAALGQVVENRFIMAIANNNRNPLALVALAPGITGAVGGTSFISNGVRNNSAEVMLDGGALTGIEQNGGVNEVKFNTTTDVIQEFKIQTNFFSAEFGNSGGTIINMVSKSGTNELHGVGYYFRRDNALNANTWQSNRSGGKLVDSKRDNWGFTAGGPVYIPKVYNGKNRTFFFGDFDRVTSMAATSQSGSVPTAQQLLGDFSDTRTGNGTLIPLFDPFSTYKDAAGNTLRNPISGNLIPLSRQNKIAQEFNKYYPAATLPGDNFTRNNNWFAQGSSPGLAYKTDGKIDHNISEKQRFTVRYGASWGPSYAVNLTGNVSHNATEGKSRQQNFIVDYTRTHSPTTIIALRAGVLRVASVRDPISNGFDATTLGLPKDIQAAGVSAFPLYNTGFRAMGSAGYAIIHRFEDTYQYSGSITKIQGGHTIKGGAEYRMYHENYFQPNTPNGSFTFGAGTTSSNVTTSIANQGNGLASALLGWGTGGVISVDYPAAQTAGYFGTYINDDWRITRKLTLNLGFRYDFDIPRTDRFNRINWLDMSSLAPVVNDNPGLKAIYPKGIYGLMKFVDDSKRTPYDGDWNNVQPRFGLAYALNTKTSIRGGYGLFYTISRHTVKGEVGTAFGFTDSSVPWSLDGGVTQFATLSNPWPLGVTFPPGRNPNFFLGRGAGTPSPKDDNPQYQQWNFSIQREIPGAGVIEANYVGTKGTHLYFGQGGDAVSNTNPLDPMFWNLGRGNGGSGPTAQLNTLVPNPFFGVITDPQATAYNQPTIALNRLLRPYPAYTSTGGYRASRNLANSMYHALQMKYEKRFSHGLSMIAHYTISKMISDSDVSGGDVTWLPGSSTVQDVANLRNERSLSVFDIPQRAVISFDYLLPVGRGRAFGKSMNRVLDAIVGGWEVSGIFTMQSGIPMGISQSTSNLWQGGQRPNLVGDPSNPAPVRDKLNNYFNTAAFSQVGADLMGSTPRLLPSYRGPGLLNEDITFMKNFAVAEKKSLQLRLEAYSATNSPQWSNPGTAYAPGSTAFGQITGAGGNRAIQIAAKFYY